jgi:hypothetical protein
MQGTMYNETACQFNSTGKVKIVGYKDYTVNCIRMMKLHAQKIVT